MSCEFEDDLTAYVDQELPPLRVRQLEGHLAGCASCPEVLALLRRTVAAVEAMPAFAPSAQLRRDVLNRISAEPPSLLDRLRVLWRPSALVPALSAAALLAVGVVAMRVARHDPATPDAPVLVADISELEMAQDLELMEDLDVAGLESPEDVEVVERLRELEGQP